jgi:uncharacterized Zn-finger protein
MAAPLLTYACPSCGNSFANEPALRWHQQTHTPSLESGSYACRECGTNFPSSERLQEHAREIHSKAV